MAVALGAELVPDVGGVVATLDGDSAPAPGLWITDGSQHCDPSEFAGDVSQPFDWTASGNAGGRPGFWADGGAEVRQEADGQVSEVAFASGWTEAAVAAGSWFWNGEWQNNEWCEVWGPCDNPEWMMGMDGVYDGPGADGQSCNDRDEAGAWQKGGSKGSWEAGDEQSGRWQDRRLDGPRPYRSNSGPLRPCSNSSKWGPRPMGRSHIYVPRRLNLEERFRERAEEEVTTLMIRNVPNRYDRNLLMQELDMLGFQGKYDFLYLPIDNATHWNVGYAFVNFDEPKDAEGCMRALEGHQFYKFRQGKKRVAQVSIAHIQGLEQNLAHCSGTSVFSVPSPWLRPWVRKRPGRTPSGSECEPLTGEALRNFERSKIGSLLSDVDAEEDWARSRSGTADFVAPPVPPLEPRPDTSTVELRISSGMNDVVWDTLMRRVISSGARRLRLLPSSPVTRLIGSGGVIFSPRMKSTLQAIANTPELKEVEVEVATTENEPPLVMNRSQMLEHLGMQSRSWNDDGCSSNTGCVETVLMALGAEFAGDCAVGPDLAADRDGSSGGRQLRGVSLPPQKARNSDFAGTSAKTRSGSMTANTRSASRGKGSRPPRKRGSVGASRRHAATGNASGTPGPAGAVKAAAAPEGCEVQEAASWPSLGSPAPQATVGDLAWPQKPQMEDGTAAPPCGAPAPQTWGQTMPNGGAEAWASGLAPVGMSGMAAATTLTDSDIRLWYLCPNAWCDNSANCDQEFHAPMQGFCDPCKFYNKDGSSTGTDGADGSPRPSGSEVAHVDTSDTSTASEKAYSDRDQITTLVIRNLPANYSQDMVYRELEVLDLHMACNLIYLPYLPVDTVMPWNIGCAFVNFWTPDDAERARTILAGHVWTDGVTGSRKVADISTAIIQGYEANVQHYNLTAVKDTCWDAAPVQANWGWMGSGAAAPQPPPAPGACAPNFASMPSSPAPEYLPEPSGEDAPHQEPMPPTEAPSVDVRGRSGTWQVPERICSRTPSPDELRHHSCTPQLHHHHEAISSPNLDGHVRANVRVRSRSPPRSIEYQEPAEGLPAAPPNSLEGCQPRAAVKELAGAAAAGGAGAEPPKQVLTPTKKLWKKEGEDDDDKKGGDDERPLGITEWPSLGGGAARRRKSSRCPRSRIPRNEIINGTVR